MAAFFYNVALCLYYAGIRITSLWNAKARLWVKGRKGWRENLCKQIEPGVKYIWFHCSSLGEFEQGRPLIEECKTSFPDHKIILTFFSPSGYEVRKNYSKADVVIYLPADSRKNARLFLSAITPRLIVFVKYEYWHNYFSEIKIRNIPFFLVSATFRKQQPFFRFYGALFRRMLAAPQRIFVQNHASANLLHQIGIDNVEVAGDTRFDRVVRLASEVKDLPVFSRFKGNNKLVVAGSTWPEDEKLIASVFLPMTDNVNIVIVPHNVSQKRIGEALKIFGNNAMLLSSCGNGIPDSARVIIVDQVGLLSRIYRYADIAIVGGGFGKGIHNTLEPAVYGIPVLFGPKYEKFNEAKGLIAAGAAFMFSSETELLHIAEKLLPGDTDYLPAAKAAVDFVGLNKGATSRIMKDICRVLDQ
ncbi:MAG: 3-deoxy-D-manno-octulosonic acid transferase [Bacteroidetes bacterium]|nr:3-deoxy-D-manno-octulosonic acid transferase [Bacteroidota bacterium]MBU1718956.1 3-deoxy-D-manno-octulosonic acid transferase [Bacteroidota bacterium]